jgi:thymidylate synthase (FAD)
MEDKGYGTEVDLLAITALSPNSNMAQTNTQSDGEDLIEFAGRLCWGTNEKIGENPDRIQEWLASGHESPTEHASATFFIRCSRAVTHELVRHRIASYNERSQRYVSESVPSFIQPPEVNIETQAGSGEEIFAGSMKSSWEAYNKLLSLGVKKEIARYVLPNACKTQIVMTMNFRELRHFIKLRTSKKALPEIREVANKVLMIMKEKAPKVFSDL